jgi:hypothetical protein
MGLKEETIAKLAGQKSKPEETIDDVEKQAKDMGVIQGAMNTAKQLAGTGALETQLAEANKRAEKAADAERKAVEDKHKAEIDKVEATLGGKIDGLAKSYAGGASKETIADQIAEIKKAANELGMGTSKISELREMMSLISTLNPQKSMIDQIKDAKELIAAIVPPVDTHGGLSVGGMPASIALELKKMDHDVQITLESMKDERQRRDQEFQLRIKQWDIEREDRLGEAQARIQVEQERNKMFGGAVETVGKAIGHGIAEASQAGGQRAGPIAGNAAQSAKSYIVDLEPTDSNKVIEFNCPVCKTKLAVGPDATEASCIRCSSKFTFNRQPAVAMPGPVLPTEEE